MTKRILAVALATVMLLGSFVMPSTVVRAEPTYDINKTEGYDVVIGSEKSASNYENGMEKGIALDKGTVLIRKSEALPENAYINFYTYMMTIQGNRTLSDYFTCEIIVSYENAKNYRFVRFYQMSGVQYFSYYTVDDGTLSGETSFFRNLSKENRFDPAKPFLVTVNKITSSAVLTLAQPVESNYGTDIKTLSVSVSTLPNDINTCVLGGGSTMHSENLLYTGIAAWPLTQSDFTRLKRERNGFLDSYAELFTLSAQFVTKNYQEQIAQARADYETLSDYGKMSLVIEKAQLDNLNNLLGNAQTEAELQPGDANYMNYQNDFSGGFSGFTNMNNQIARPELVELEGNSVLKLPTGPLSGIRLKQYMLPTDVVIATTSFDFKCDKYNTWQQLKFMYAFKDAQNYTYASFEIQTNNRFAYSVYEVVDGIQMVRQNNVIAESYAVQMDFTQWSHIDLLYNGKSVNVIMTVGGVTLPVMNFGCSFVPKSFVLLAPGANNMFYDNINITYEEYVEPAEDQSNKLAVYYTGNTEQYPNDTVQVTGNNIYDNVSSIQIMELANTNLVNTQSYIKTDWFSGVGYEGNFIRSTEADYDAELWKNAVTVEILQPTDGTLKFVIPAHFAKGMYAVRFNGFDYTSSEDDVIYYLNRPRISFVAGDEGKIATAGGSLKIVGDMLVWGHDAELPYYNESTMLYSYPNVRVLLKGTNYSRIFEPSEFVVENANGIQLPVPADLKQGTYEISVYNGIGGTDGWSAPVEVTIGESPRASWPTDVFNVKDFGATGEKWHNATGAVVKALEAAALNGGGVVYFPEGQYNLCSSIVIPENVVVKGDGQNRSIVFWSMDMWPDGSLPAYAVGFTKNVEFKDLGFYACRISNWFVSTEEDVKNVYFNNLYVYTNPYGQYPTDANSGADGSGEVGRNELFDMIREEISDQAIVFSLLGGDMSEDGAQNIRFDQVRLVQSGTSGGLRGISSESDYFYANQLDMTGGGWDTVWGGSHAIFQNSEHTMSAISILGIGMYFYNNNLHDVYHNNRELFVADYPSFGTCTLRKLDKGSEATGDKDCWYEIVGKKYGNDAIRFYQLKVVDGQGKMQSRYVVTNQGNQVRINSPFAVEPDANSVVNIREGRLDTYFVQNTLDEGGAGLGWYSGTVGVVYDGNKRTRCGNYLYTWSYDAIWYVSFVNESFDEPYMFGGYGYSTGNNVTVTNDNGGYTSLHLSSGPVTPPGAFLAFTVRRSQFLNGSYIDFVFTIDTEGARCILIEDNEFDRVSTPIIFSNNIRNYDGAMIRNNTFTRVNNVLSTSTERNVYGSPRIMVVMDKQSTSGAPLGKGDVNGDGKVSLKDVSVLKYYLADMTVLDAAALDRADVNSSGYVTLKDAAAIRHFVTYGTWVLNYVDTMDNNGGFFEGNW